MPKRKRSRRDAQVPQRPLSYYDQLIKGPDWARRDKRNLKRGARTAITFSAEELMALARFAVAGRVLLQTSHLVFSKLKSAISRLGLQAPTGI